MTDTRGDFRWLRDGMDHANTVATLASAAESTDPEAAAAAEANIAEARALYAERVKELEKGGAQ